MFHANKFPYLIPSFENILVIGLVGRSGSGKGECSNFMEREMGYVCQPFAKNLKTAARIIFNLKETDTNTQEGKKLFNEYWDRTHREMLQLLGTEAMQPVFGRDIWVKSAHIEIYKRFHDEEQHLFVIDDVRFQHEVDYIQKEMNGFIIRVNRNDVGQNLTSTEKLHKSETEIDNLKISMEGLRLLSNNSTIAHLTADLYDLVEEIERVHQAELDMRNNVIPSH